ncbi:hypothetical protein LTR36_009906 [Oleoguttula mirabilis]|uniref:Uncharacterized protein n=1 Tax=Oleoguttula mirabilis TaxID=1507867 RepID=A0AAV9J5I3_9PEZI|nr:hypothetical protein LTR36_009906 [Oleoguttula mirabilis]
MSAKGMSWDAAADRKLLLGILKMQNISIDYDAMAEYMATDEQKCTPSAIMNRVKKLRAMAKDGSTGSDDGTPKSKGTPLKRKAGGDLETPAKKAKTTKGGKGSKGKTANAEDEDEDDGETGEMGAVKQEGGEEED